MADKKADKPNLLARTGAYSRDVRAEMRRVVWPSRAEVINSSVVVVVTLIFFILFTLVVDQVASFVFIDLPARIGG